MKLPADSIRRYLTKKYAAIAGSAFSFREGWSERFDAPAWIPVSTKLLSPAKGSDRESILIADPDVAVLLYLIPLNRIEDVPITISKASAIRSQLLPIPGGSRSTDPLAEGSSWRIVLHWLTESTERRAEWIARLAELRVDANYSEEVPVDIICAADGDWELALERHGLPRLLLNLRAVLQASEPRQIESWLSADAALEAALHAFDGALKSEDERSIARGVRDRFAQMRSESSAAGSWGEALEGFSTVNNVVVKDFRNISAVSLGLGQEKVGATVITGPNGSGKSALFEALSIAIGGVSDRYIRFLMDADVRPKDKSKEYLSNYLARHSAGNRHDAALLVDGKQIKLQLPNDRDQALARRRRIEGSFLSQEQSNQFVHADAATLASAVLGHYSANSARLMTYVEDEYTKADIGKQNLLRSFGARANIVNRKTAYRRAVEQALNEAVPYSEGALMSWLDLTASQYGMVFSGADGLAARWKSWVDQRAVVIEGILDRLAEDRVVSHIDSWLVSFNNCISELEGWLRNNGLRDVPGIRGGGADVANQIEAWGVWLQEQGRLTIQKSKADEIQARIKKIEEEQKLLVEKGQLLKGRLEHLRNATSFVEDRWVKSNPSTCPTCDSDLTSQGGIAATLAKVQRDVESQYASAQSSYRTLASNLKATSEDLVRLGIKPRPVTVEQQQIIEELARVYRKVDEDLPPWLIDNQNRLDLIRFTRHIAAMPAVPSSRVQVESAARKTAERIVALCENIDKVFEQPDKWREVLQRLRHLYSGVVQAHLPKTIEGLWREIAFAMTSARWLVTGAPSIAVETFRGQQTARIQMADFQGQPLARHILNQAEIHVLGLSWFFVRYLTAGRFLGPYLVLDDPAQEMDQTTYKDFCRFLESLLRLHKRTNQPLNIVLLLHQEDRAIDAARSLNALLTVLSWTDTQVGKSVTGVKLYGDAPYWPRPETVLAQ
jgi:energy-coupling factor transporter ATP-binding protein EcfA2